MTFKWPEGKVAAVTLVYDDARLTQIDNGMEILARHGVRASFYITPASAAKRLDGWKRAIDAGHEIANHTMTHPCSGNFPWSRGRALEEMTLSDIEREIDEANDWIEKNLGVTPVSFAYPCAQKFVGRGVTRQSYVPLVARKFLIGRDGFNEVPNDPEFVDLAVVGAMEADGATLKKLRRLTRWAIKEGRWLVLFSHEVVDDDKQGIRPEVLDAYCQYITKEERGLWVDTGAAIGKYIADSRQK